MADTLKAQLSEWPFAKREKALFELARKIPTWRVANQARQFLASVSSELGERIATPAVKLVSELDAETAIRMACVQLAAIVVRESGAILALISCGHERESFAHSRTIVEALVRAQQARDDSSGHVARLILEGRSPGSLKSAAQRYSDAEHVKILNHFAHSDVLSLRPIGTPRENGVEADLQLLPQRGRIMPARQLHEVARDATSFGGLLAEVFNVPIEIPAFLSGELLRLKDEPPGRAD